MLEKAHLMTAVPKYLRHSSGQARVILNGRVFYLGKHGSKASKQRYDTIIAEWLATNRSPTFGLDAAELTIQALMLAYLQFAKRHYGTGETSEYRRIKYALRPLASLYPECEVVSFGPVQFKAVRQQMITLGWARTNINDSMKRVLRMIKWGAAEGSYPAASYETLRLIPSLKRGRTEAKESKPVQAVCKLRVAKTIEKCSPIVADMVKFQLLTGCRPGEVCRLTPKMFDRAKDVWIVELAEHKTAHHGRERFLLVGPEAQKIITPYLLRDANARLFRPCDSEEKRRAAIKRKTPDNCGNRRGYSKRAREGRKAKTSPGITYTSRAYAKAIRYACSKAFPVPQDSDEAATKKWREAEWWSPNQLRHTSATKLRAEFGIDVAATILGHSKVETTQIYAEQAREKAIEVARKIG